MKAITLRNIPPDVARLIRRLADEKGVSLNRAVIDLLRQTLGIPSRPKKKVVHHDLDFMFGQWTKEEADEFDKALAEIRVIDPELWT